MDRQGQAFELGCDKVLPGSRQIALLAWRVFGPMRCKLQLCRIEMQS